METVSRDGADVPELHMNVDDIFPDPFSPQRPRPECLLSFIVILRVVATCLVGDHGFVFHEAFTSF